jgi:tRNA-Thr(GGU) m(6)t(6)A37 methyltransferase TsaA
MTLKEDTYLVQAVGRVRQLGRGAELQIYEPFRSALVDLGQFSHVIVLWWGDRHDNPRSRAYLQVEPPYARGRTMGVFATRVEYRPNPIGVTICKMLGVDEETGIVKVANIDAFDGTRILDLKAFFPNYDRVKEAHLPEWLPGWAEWMPEEGLGL